MMVPVYCHSLNREQGAVDVRSGTETLLNPSTIMARLGLRVQIKVKGLNSTSQAV